MRTLVLYHPKSEFAGKVEEFQHEFQGRHPDKKVELISLETKEGAEMAQTYDVVRYPAIMVLGPNGELQKFWQDQPFPLVDEVAAYAFA